MNAVLLAQNMVFPSLVETQRFGAPSVVHNMRRSGLATATAGVRRDRRECFPTPILTRLLCSAGTWHLHEAGVVRKDLQDNCTI
jgi:hypothetical protein